jgi:hypothetical protein
MSSRERHELQVARVRASLGLSPRDHVGCWKPSARSVDVVERPTGIRR